MNNSSLAKWIDYEFSDIELGDERLNKRFFKVSNSLNAISKATEKLKKEGNHIHFLDFTLPYGANKSVRKLQTQFGQENPSAGSIGEFRR